MKLVVDPDICQGYGLCHGIYYPTLQAMVVERAGGHPGRAITAST